MTTEPKTPEKVLAWKAVRWRNAAGWLVVAIISWRYLVHPITNTILVAYGAEPLAAAGDLSLADVGAIIGLPVGGSFADRLTEGPSNG